jgi:hypothetical protein
VVGDDVEQHPQAVLVGLGDQRLGLLEGAEPGLDRPVVRDVVAGVGHRGRVPRVDPDRVDAEIREVGQLGPDAGDVAEAVAVTVGEAADVDLVDDGVAPPVRACLGAHATYLHQPSPSETSSVP